MAQHQALLELRKDVGVIGAHDSQPFCLSLRDPSEFCEVHSFGFHKVPHIGVYGEDYSICSPLVLLSLPATPRALQVLPHDLLSALDLNEVVTEYSSHQSVSKLRENEHQSQLFSHFASFHNVSGNGITTVAQKLVKAVIEAAVRRVQEEEEGTLPSKIAGRRESKMDISEITSQTKGGMDVWNEAHTTIKEGSDCDESVESGEEGGSFDGECRVCFPRHTNDTKFDDPYDIEKERRSLARRLVLKCIQAACNEISSRQHLGGSVESLISSTKRMRIDSPPPPTPLSNVICSSSKATSNTTTTTTTLTTSRSPMFDRCLTPESLRREKLWKKRGRSESHEVNSLLDYDTDHCRYRSTGIKVGGDTNSDGVIEEEYDDSGSENGLTLSSIVTDLNKMTIRVKSSNGEDEEEEEEYECERQTHTPSTGDSIKRGVTFNVSSPLIFHHRMAPLRSPPPPRPPSPPPPTMSIDDQVLDVRAAANKDCIPEMDFYFIIHSSPTPGICQKFLCNNMNEINLLFHCWLFRGAPCDPSITLSDQLEMGVFLPHRVQPIHLELVDGGIPFLFMEERSVIIHSCCFSPENAQLQLQSRNNSETHPGSPSDFHSFFSAGRHRDRRVVTFHLLPSSYSTEKTLKEVTQSCSTLRQLVDLLGSCFPEIRETISSFISPLEFKKT